MRVSQSRFTRTLARRRKNEKEQIHGDSKKKYTRSIERRAESDKFPGARSRISDKIYRFYGEHLAAS